jgi:hypothetical protein
MLRDNAGDDLTVGGNGAFTFATAVASGSAFAVTIARQPGTPAQSCSVSGGAGTVGGAPVTSVTVNCAVDHFTVGGTVSGLVAGDLLLSLNGGASMVLASNGGFAFPSTVASGDAYAVTIVHQPTSPWQTCMLGGATGSVGASNVTGVTLTCSTNRYTVGGTVSGLAGSGLVLRDNGADDLAVPAAGATFAFATRVTSGQSYAVTVAAQPTNPSQTCAVASAAGNVGGGDIGNVRVTCVTNTYPVGGTVTGLAGTVVLDDNMGDPIVLSSAGPFTFPTAVASGMTYAVAITTQPSSPAQTCTVGNGSGTVTAAAIGSVIVTCVTNTYSVGGTVSGLAGSGLVLLNNAGDALSVSGAGPFWFATTVASGQQYAVTIAAQPAAPTQTCTLGGQVGTVGASSVSSVTVNCVINSYLIGGTVTGLLGTGLALLNNGGDDLAVSGDGSFAFATPIASGGSYAVTIKSSPTSPTQTCAVSSGSGDVASSDVSAVSVVCTSTTFAVSANVSGLSGSGLVLRNNGGDDVPVAADGVAVFSTPVASGQAYNVTVATQPSEPPQTCTVTSPTGIVADSAVSVGVVCTTD